METWFDAGFNTPMLHMFTGAAWWHVNRVFMDAHGASSGLNNYNRAFGEMLRSGQVTQELALKIGTMALAAAQLAANEAHHLGADAAPFHRQWVDTAA